MLVATPRVSVFVLYPLVPWLGVMAAGYALGPVMLMEPSSRRQRLFDVGLGVTLGFVVLRACGFYGDPVDWRIVHRVVPTVLSFLDCEKYPPSLLYLLMTLGPALMALALLDGVRGRFAGVLISFGRTPMAYYLVHIYAIHVLSIVAAAAGGHGVAWLFDGPGLMNKPPAWGFGLPTVYLIWLSVVAMLYPLCRWFGRLKQRRRDAWLSYL
jgi:uncharacterized membrane protein